MYIYSIYLQYIFNKCFLTKYVFPMTEQFFFCIIIDVLLKHLSYSCSEFSPGPFSFHCPSQEGVQAAYATPVVPPKPQTNIVGWLGMTYGLIRCYFLLTGGEISAISAAKFRSRVALTP